MKTTNVCDFDPNAISIKEAQAIVEKCSNRVAETEVITIHQALGRVLREDIISPLNNPPFDNSAMDGYAVKHANTATVPVTLKLVGESFAGHPYIGPPLQSGQAIRIMTGAKVPEGADTIVMQEQTFRDNDAEVRIDQPTKQGQNLRQCGEDVKIGQPVLTMGTLITPACIGVLASMGVFEVKVSRKIRVGILSTGDELQSIGTVLKLGNIYDSNRYSLHGLLAQAMITVVDKGVITDERASIENTILELSKNCDVIFTTGGVSVGEADWIKSIIDETGQLYFWKVAIKPGRPVAFAKINQALFFGLPGNPVSVMITFEAFASIALQKLSGQLVKKPLRIKVKSQSKIRKKAGRAEFQRGILSYDEQGELTVKSTGDQGSGILSSMSQANCLIVLDTEKTGAEIGDIVHVEPFEFKI